MYVPRSRRGLVPRPRLSERLDRVAASKLTLVSAPAGFGKTTLLAEWVAAGSATPTMSGPAAWLSLDQGDNDPASFWTHVIAALRTVAPGVGETMLALLQERQLPAIQTVTSLHTLVLVPAPVAMQHVWMIGVGVVAEPHCKPRFGPGLEEHGVLPSRELCCGRLAIDVEYLELHVVDVEVVELAVGVFDLPDLGRVDLRLRRYGSCPSAPR